MTFKDYVETFDEIEFCYLVGPGTKWKGAMKRAHSKKPNRNGGEHWPLLIKNPQVNKTGYKVMNTVTLHYYIYQSLLKD